MTFETLLSYFNSIFFLPEVKTASNSNCSNSRESVSLGSSLRGRRGSCGDCEFSVRSHALTQVLRCQRATQIRVAWKKGVSKG